MQKAAVYVRDPLPTPGSITSKEDQETTCREYRQARILTVSATFILTAGSRDEFTRMISEATRDDSTLDFIVVWKLNRFSMSLEETIEMRDTLRGVGTRLVSTTERGIGDYPPSRFHQSKPRSLTPPAGMPTARVLAFLEANKNRDNSNFVTTSTYGFYPSPMGADVGAAARARNRISAHPQWPRRCLRRPGDSSDSFERHLIHQHAAEKGRGQRIRNGRVIRSHLSFGSSQVCGLR